MSRGEERDRDRQTERMGVVVGARWERGTNRPTDRQTKADGEGGLVWFGEQGDKQTDRLAGGGRDRQR